MSGFLTPEELSKTFVIIGKSKANNTMAKLFILGILAGVFIGFAAHLATVVATGWTIGGDSILFGLKKFFVGAVFSVGLMIVIIPGSELWTGNNLMTIALLNKDITLVQMMRNWVIVYIGNFIGSILLAFMIASLTGLTDGPVGGTAINVAYGKVTTGENIHNFWYFFRAIACNWLVCLAVMMAVAAKDITGKILAIFFPIMAFVTSGFEHIIANMYYIPAGIFSKEFTKAVIASGKSIEILTVLNWSSMITQNFITVTLGNFMGGGIFCGIIYWWVYVKKK
ncbi:MAG: formate/nitrite transporter family protein [Flavobacteriaceae bacterium]|nr:formate/nitrite transporter family protein [Bacteroidales bacterium]MCK5678540.1 formate/nitrite transporter family protein [Flavobacteriaceae bacterium]